MKILLIGGRLAATRWSGAGFVRLVARGLMSRGHEVTLACQSADDDTVFAPARVVEMMAYDQNGTDWPRGFGRWALRAAQELAPDAVVSVSRRAWGDVWMPMGPTAEAAMAMAVGALGPVGLGKWLYKHPGAVAARAAELRRPWPRGPGGRRPGRVGVVGVEAAAGARAALASHRLDSRVVALPFVSACEPPDELGRARARALLRETLGVGPRDTLVLVSRVGYVGDSLRPLFDAARRINEAGARGGRGGAGGGRTGGIVLGVLARDAFHAHDDAVRAGASASVRVLGTTARAEAALAACDAVAVPAAQIPDAFVTGATGRFAADALRLARPLLIADGAPGAELVESLPGLGEPGVVVRGDGVEPEEVVWERALRKAMDEPWRDRATVAAAAAGGPERVGVNRFVDALEGVIEGALGERRRAMRPRV